MTRRRWEMTAENDDVRMASVRTIFLGCAVAIVVISFGLQIITSSLLSIPDRDFTPYIEDNFNGTATFHMMFATYSEQYLSIVIERNGTDASLYGFNSTAMTFDLESGSDGAKTGERLPVGNFQEGFFDGDECVTFATMPESDYRVLLLWHGDEVGSVLYAT